MGAQRRAAQDIAQFARLAERIAVHQAHLLDVDVRLEETVVEHQSAGSAAQQRVADRQHVRKAHRQLHRHGNLHLGGNLAHDVGIVALYFLRRGPAICRKQEDVQLQRRSAGLLHGRGIFDPHIARAGAVDAADDGNARLGGIGNQLQQLRLIGFAQITFEVFPGIAVTFHTVERGGLTVNLLLENRLQHHGARAVADTLLDIADRRGIGRTADYDGAGKVQPEIFRFHRVNRLRFIRTEFSPLRPSRASRG